LFKIRFGGKVDKFSHKKIKIQLAVIIKIGFN